VTLFFGIKSAFFAFFSKTTKRICAQFFQGLGEHLFITACTEKQCTWPLKNGMLIKPATSLVAPYSFYL